LATLPAHTFGRLSVRISPRLSWSCRRNHCSRNISDWYCQLHGCYRAGGRSSKSLERTLHQQTIPT